MSPPTTNGHTALTGRTLGNGRITFTEWIKKNAADRRAQGLQGGGAE